MEGEKQRRLIGDEICGWFELGWSGGEWRALEGVGLRSGSMIRQIGVLEERAWCWLRWRAEIYSWWLGRDETGRAVTIKKQQRVPDLDRRRASGRSERRFSGVIEI